MPTQPQLFRDRYERCDWIFDLFAHGFDFLNGRFFPPKLEGHDEDWEREDEDVRKRNLVDLVARADGDIPIELRRYLRIPGADAELEMVEFCLRLYCALNAIDRGVADLNYLAGFARPLPGRWERATEHLELKRRQLQRSASGHVVFRPRDFETAGTTWPARTPASGRWTQLPTRGVNLSDYFRNLLRVEETNDCSVDIRLVSPAQDFEMDPTELRIGIVPLVDALKANPTDALLLPGPLRLVKETDSPPAFGIRVDPPRSIWCT
jgi:hypothetical protein